MVCDRVLDMKMNDFNQVNSIRLILVAFIYSSSPTFNLEGNYKSMKSFWQYYDYNLPHVNTRL